MTRGIGRSGSGRPVLNELHYNGEPPQSTRAAQLVNQITDGKRRPTNQDEETFKLLLKEVLDSEDDVTSTATTLENNLDVNYKLIYVIVKAGLDTLVQDNPFKQRKEHIRQTTESLFAIRLTLRRTPAVIFTVPATNDGEPLGNVPLFLWLMPKLLTLLSPSIDDEIREAAKSLLEFALKIEQRIHMRGVKAKTLLRYLQGWVGGQSWRKSVVSPTDVKHLQIFYVTSKTYPVFTRRPSSQHGTSPQTRRSWHSPRAMPSKTTSADPYGPP